MKKINNWCEVCNKPLSEESVLIGSIICEDEFCERFSKMAVLYSGQDPNDFPEETQYEIAAMNVEMMTRRVNNYRHRRAQQHPKEVPFPDVYTPLLEYWKEMARRLKPNLAGSRIKPSGRIVLN